MRILSNFVPRVSLGIIVVMAAHSVAHRASAQEVTVQNDSVVDGAAASICPCFAVGESAAAWLTSPCDGDIVAVQVFWRSFLGGAPQSLEDSISIFEAGAVYPTPGPVMVNQPSPAPAVLVGPVLSDGVLNEFRFLDEFSTIPIEVPVTDGQVFVVSLRFLNPNAGGLGPSVVFDQDGCQANRNAIFAIPGGWIDACAAGVTGDWVIRAVVDCGAQPGACCESTGDCTDGVTLETCATGGGAYAGDGTNCAGVTCNEACCFAGGGCLDLTQTNCGVAGGFPEGPGTDCGTTVCFPMGACCDPDGSCDDDIDPTDCTDGGGTYQGNDSVCDGSCPQPEGACCLSGGGCLSLTQVDCTVIPNSTWAGAFTGCPDDCAGIPVGACCNADGTCDDGIAETTCTSGGGIFQGDLSVCDGSCPDPVGACCVGQACTLETDADCTGMSGTWSGVLTDCSDGNGNTVPDECEAPPCTTADDCADLEPNGTTDDVCVWWECVAGSCLATNLSDPSDMGGAFGACPPDTFCNLADALHALTCFSGDNTCDTINIDAGGAFGDCAPDGFCNLADALHALTCFSGDNPCTCGPAPAASGTPNVIGEATLIAVPSGRAVKPGQEIQVRAFITLQSPERKRRAGRDSVPLRAYQLHADVSGGRSGALELIGITVEDREDYVFAEATDNMFDAFNVQNGQMLAGLFDGSIATASPGYLATFTYRASADAAGTFVVDIVRGDPTQTMLVGFEQTDKIEVARTSPAVITVTAERARGLR